MENATARKMKKLSRDDKKNAARVMAEVFDMLDTRVGDKARWSVELTATNSPHEPLVEQYFSLMVIVYYGGDTPVIYRSVLTEWAFDKPEALVAGLAKYLDEKFPE